GSVHVAFPGHEATAAGFDDRQSSEAVQLQFKDPIRMVKRLAPHGQGHGGELRKHLAIIVGTGSGSALVNLCIAGVYEIVQTVKDRRTSTDCSEHSYIGSTSAGPMASQSLVADRHW